MTGGHDGARASVTTTRWSPTTRPRSAARPRTSSGTQIFAIARSICINVRQAAISAAAGVDYLLPGDETNPLLGVVEGWISAS